MATCRRRNRRFRCGDGSLRRTRSNSMLGSVSGAVKANGVGSMVWRSSTL
jgi:hypothetical protein